MAEKEEGEGEEEKATASLFPIHGDLLEEVLRHLSTVDFVSALYVSTAWQQAVHSSLRRAPRSKPWLFLHAQSRRNPCAVATHAYDPHSRVWIQVAVVTAPKQPISSALRSSPSCGLLYELTPSRLAVRTGGLGAPWRELGAPLAWRTDPVVEAVGAHVVVAGGTCGFLDDDPCAVELHRVDGAVALCETMPDAFRSSASATFLSAAASHEKMYVMEKSTGLICSFDAETGKWGGTALLRPDPSLFSSAIAFSGYRLILAGLGGDGKNAVSLQLWAVDCVSFECESVGAMPGEMFGRLAGEDDSSLSSVDIAVVGDFAYVWKPSDPAVIISCDFSGGECRWMEVLAPARVCKTPADRWVFTCSEVGMDDLRGCVLNFGPDVLTLTAREQCRSSLSAHMEGSGR